MKKTILLILILLTFTPAQAAPTGQALVVVATCRESIVMWLSPTAPAAGTYASVIFDAEQHGATYPVEVLYQYTTTLDNGRAVYRAIDWQPFSLNAERLTIKDGYIIGPGGSLLEPIAAGTVFVMDCNHVYMPVVVR